jgi:hypothetical protein
VHEGVVVRDDEEFLAIKERAAVRLMRLPGVTGVGIGGRVRGGRPTGQPVLKVFVTEKKPLADLSPGEVVPTEFEGVPTDVVVLGPVELDVDPPPGRGVVPVDQIDGERRRPLIGGSQLQVDLSGSGYGTLGCFLTKVGDPTKVYALTNHHVLSTGSLQPTFGTTKAGQPTNEDSSTKCCSHIIGVVAGGGKDPLRDAGIVQLAPGMQWQADILEIGAVSGAHDVTVAEAVSQTYPVRKRGARSRLTGGTIQAINVTLTVASITHTNLTVVQPNPDPTDTTGRPLFFSQKGDSGSAVVNDANEVVALHFAKSPANPNQSVSTPIGAVIARFQAVEHLAVAVATAARPGIVNTVPGTAMIAVPREVRAALLTAGDPVSTAAAAPTRIPVGGWLPQIVPPPAARLAGVQSELDRSAAGRMFITAWLRHQHELVDLVHTNSRVAAVWHRSGGSALSQCLIRMLDQPSLALPERVNGQPVAHCVNRLQEVFTRYGSAELRRDLIRVRTVVPELSGRTYPQIVAALTGGPAVPA